MEEAQRSSEGLFVILDKSEALCGINAEGECPTLSNLVHNIIIFILFILYSLGFEFKMLDRNGRCLVSEKCAWVLRNVLGF